MDNHKQKPWHSQRPEEIYRDLGTSPAGLSDAEALERLRKNGRNELREKPPKTIREMLKAQILDPMVLILLGAAALSAFLREWTEAAVIFIIVIVNAIIGIVQEKKAQSSLAALRKMSAPTARALRQGEESIVPAAELVTGDVVLLGDGDMVPADLRLIDSANLKIQEASLTGESVPSEKEADQVLPEDCPLGDRSNMAYTSSIVTYGRAVGVVVATGMDTEVGGIAVMLDRQEDMETPLKRFFTRPKAGQRSRNDNARWEKIILYGKIELLGKEYRKWITINYNFLKINKSERHGTRKRKNGISPSLMLSRF